MNAGEIRSHTLRRMHFFSSMHQGSMETLRETTRKVYAYMSGRGLSPELELAEVYHQRGAKDPVKSRIEVMASFLA